MIIKSDKPAAFIERADNGFVVHLMRPKKSYAPDEEYVHKKYVFLSTEPALNKMKEFMEDPFKEKE